MTNDKIEQIPIVNHEIISLIRKANGSDGISGLMLLLLCDNLVILPLRIIFNNILSTALYPDIWKLANVTPVFRKGNKQLMKNYRPVSLLHPVSGKIFEKIILTIFTLAISPKTNTNELIDMVNEIHHAFDSTKSLEVRAVFLDIHGHW